MANSYDRKVCFFKNIKFHMDHLRGIEMMKKFVLLFASFIIALVSSYTNAGATALPPGTLLTIDNGWGGGDLLFYDGGIHWREDDRISSIH